MQKHNNKSEKVRLSSPDDAWSPVSPAHPRASANEQHFLGPAPSFVMRPHWNNKSFSPPRFIDPAHSLAG